MFFVRQEVIEKWELFKKTSTSLGQLLDAAEAKMAPDQLEAISSFELEHYLAETKVDQQNLVQSISFILLRYVCT